MHHCQHVDVAILVRLHRDQSVFGGLLRVQRLSSGALAAVDWDGLELALERSLLATGFGTLCLGLGLGFGFGCSLLSFVGR